MSVLPITKILVLVAALLRMLPGAFGLVSVDGADAAGNSWHWNAGKLTIQGGVIDVLQGAHLTSQDANFV